VWDELPAAGTRLVIVRHGESVANATGVVGGPQGCRGLSELGRRQVAALSARLTRTNELGSATQLYSSTLPRAVETARMLSPALGGLRVVTEPELCEQDPGEADGLSWLEVERRYGRSLPGDRPLEALAPGGESWSNFLVRVRRILLTLALRHQGSTTVIAAHGGIADGSMVALLGLPAHGSHIRLFSENAAITEWAATGGRWRLVRYNDAGHLVGLSSAVPKWAEQEPERSSSLPARGREAP
jgi:probable phosphoglycerate mutase